MSQQTSITHGPLEVFTIATTGTSRTLFCDGRCGYLTAVIQGNGTTSGGVIVLEEAYYTPDDGAPYSGTWSNIGTFTAGTDFTSNTQTIYHSPAPSSFWAVRMRTTSDITGGGSVTCTLWVN